MRDLVVGASWAYMVAKKLEYYRGKGDDGRHTSLA